MHGSTVFQTRGRSRLGQPTPGRKERMIGLEALKDQLKLLGHGDLADEQIVAILRDMNIDFAAGACTGFILRLKLT